MKTRVFLIRHGATELATEDRFAGTTDVSLSAVGREQARRLSLRLAHADVAAVYSSPLGRTMGTAAILAEPPACRSWPGRPCARSRTVTGRG
jgi:probable phosphoglycerate mutase